VVDQDPISGARRTLGSRLATFRHAADCSQAEFAPLVHCSRSSLANVEVGRQKGTHAFWKLCDEVLQTGGVLATDFVGIAEPVKLDETSGGVLLV
jgi:DNA-binding XRE family transcriptional regulator